ncbi:MAG: tetratricopeptide repeat protein [Paludibacter sp.]|nr:tetratricopeptide repeat protein [Paludibacter sp.]
MHKTLCNKILFFGIKIFILLIFLINNINISAQNASSNITHGNEKYNAHQFSDAEVDYRKALSADSTEFIANYNLGNALYKQGKYSEAMNSYIKALANVKTNSKLHANQLAAAFHNIGNSLLCQNQYEQSIEAYKNALKLKPQDDETRYNLAYAQQFLSKQPPSSQPPKEKDDNQNQPPKNQNPNQQQQPKMNKEEAQQLLNALMQDEKQTKADAQKAVPKSRKQPEKDW